jgi:hypothetical protein
MGGEDESPGRAFGASAQVEAGGGREAASAATGAEAPHAAAAQAPAHITQARQHARVRPRVQPDPGASACATRGGTRGAMSATRASARQRSHTQKAARGSCQENDRTHRTRLGRRSDAAAAAARGRRTAGNAVLRERRRAGRPRSSDVSGDRHGCTLARHKGGPVRVRGWPGSGRCVLAPSMAIETRTGRASAARARASSRLGAHRAGSKQRGRHACVRGA